ncbi:MAG: PilZ domain-containing protein [Planctomycetota bacterium]
MGAEQRTQYRVAAAGALSIVAELQRASGKRARARVLDTSAGGASLAFTGIPMRELEKGTVLDLWFLEAGAARQLHVQGDIRRVEIEGREIVCGIAFKDVHDFYAELTPRMWERFNRRKSYRARPEARDEVRVEVHEAGQSFDYAITDVSVLGLGFGVPPEYASRFRDGQRMRLVLTLPGAVEPAYLAAHLVHRTAFGLDDRHGVEFDPKATDAFVEQQELLLGWIVDRQRRHVFGAVRV